ncbi:hypothetical protein AwPolaro_00530 [Polaromonas sp.]|nr:hypothetical protein AwPolaro_00530 [Polaromonas sp.]
MRVDSGRSFARHAVAVARTPMDNNHKIAPQPQLTTGTVAIVPSFWIGPLNIGIVAAKAAIAMETPIGIESGFLSNFNAAITKKMLAYAAHPFTPQPRRTPENRM